MSETLIDVVTQYQEDNATEVASLIETLQGHGAADEDLDMIVHDLSDEMGFDSEDASRLNNESFELQVAAAHMSLGAQEAEKAVLEAIAERRQLQP